MLYMRSMVVDADLNENIKHKDQLYALGQIFLLIDLQTLLL